MTRFIFLQTRCCKEVIAMARRPSPAAAPAFLRDCTEQATVRWRLGLVISRFPTFQTCHSETDHCGPTHAGRTNSLDFKVTIGILQIERTAGFSSFHNGRVRKGRTQTHRK